MLRISATDGSETIGRTTHILTPEEAPRASPQALHRTWVGKLHYMVHIRPSMAFAVEELARGLYAPPYHYWARVRHPRRYLKHTKEYKLV